jgi:hypothetical protein
MSERVIPFNHVVSKLVGVQWRAVCFELITFGVYDDPMTALRSSSAISQ